MEKCQLKGKFVPDKDGKLKPVFKLTEINVNLPGPASRHLQCAGPPRPSWCGRVWRWLTSRLF